MLQEKAALVGEGILVVMEPFPEDMAQIQCWEALGNTGDTMKDTCQHNQGDRLQGCRHPKRSRHLAPPGGLENILCSPPPENRRSHGGVLTEAVTESCDNDVNGGAGSLLLAVSSWNAAGCLRSRLAWGQRPG